MIFLDRIVMKNINWTNNNSDVVFGICKFLLILKNNI